MPTSDTPTISSSTGTLRRRRGGWGSRRGLGAGAAGPICHGSSGGRTGTPAGVGRITASSVAGRGAGGEAGSGRSIGCATISGCRSGPGCDTDTDTDTDTGRAAAAAASALAAALARTSPIKRWRSDSVLRMLRPRASTCIARGSVSANPQTAHTGCAIGVKQPGHLCTSARSCGAVGQVRLVSGESAIASPCEVGSSSSHPSDAPTGIFVAPRGKQLPARSWGGTAGSVAASVRPVRARMLN